MKKYGFKFTKKNKNFTQIGFAEVEGNKKWDTFTIYLDLQEKYKNRDRWNKGEIIYKVSKKNGNFKFSKIFQTWEDKNLYPEYMYITGEEVSMLLKFIDKWINKTTKNIFKEIL